MTLSDSIDKTSKLNRDRGKTHGKGIVQAIDTSDPEQTKYKINGRWMPSLKVAVIGDIGPYRDGRDPYFLGPFAGQ